MELEKKTVVEIKENGNEDNCLNLLGCEICSRKMYTLVHVWQSMRDTVDSVLWLYPFPCLLILDSVRRYFSNFTESSFMPWDVLYSQCDFCHSGAVRMLRLGHHALLKPGTHHHSERGSASPAAKLGASVRREVSPCHHFEALLALSSNSGCFQLLPTGT